MAKIGGTEIVATLGDITESTDDAIVNAANCTLMGGGGVDGAIHRAAGIRLYAYCLKLGGCRTGEAKATPGFNLKAKHIIHTPGPVWSPKRAERCDALLRDSYYNSLTLAEELHCRTISFPSISTGIYRFPLDRAAAIVAKTFVEYFSARPESCVKRATMTCFDQKTYRAYDEAFLKISLDDPKS